VSSHDGKICLRRPASHRLNDGGKVPLCVSEPHAVIAVPLVAIPFAVRNPTVVILLEPHAFRSQRHDLPPPISGVASDRFEPTKAHKLAPATTVVPPNARRGTYTTRFASSITRIDLFSIMASVGLVSRAVAQATGAIEGTVRVTGDRRDALYENRS